MHRTFPIGIEGQYKVTTKRLSQIQIQNDEIVTATCIKMFLENKKSSSILVGWVDETVSYLIDD